MPETRERPDATNAGAPDTSAASVESKPIVARRPRRRRDVEAERRAAFRAGYMVGAAQRFNTEVGEAVRATMHDQARETEVAALQWAKFPGPDWTAAPTTGPGSPDCHCLACEMR